MLQNPFLNATRMNNSNARVSQEAKKILNIKDFMQDKSITAVNQVRITNNGIPLYCPKLIFADNTSLQISWQLTSEGFTLEDLAKEAKAAKQDIRFAVLLFDKDDQYVFGYTKEVTGTAEDIKNVQKLFDK